MGVKSRVAVLASGSGTNLQALIDACKEADYPAEIVLVLSDKPNAGALQRAKDASIATQVVLRRDFPSRDAFDQGLVEHLRAHRVDWVALAGFMRVVTPVFLDAFPWRVVNIHPSLLPSFPGLHAQEQAFNAGVQVTGATVHFVDSGVDTGPIIAQGVVPVKSSDSLDDLRARILKMEHRLYPTVLRWAASGQLAVHGGTIRVNNEEPRLLT